MGSENAGKSREDFRDKRMDELSRREDLRETRAEDLFLEQKGLLSGMASQMISVEKTMATLNHNIDQTCKRLDKFADQSHEARLKALEDWKTEMNEWRNAMFLKIIGLMGLAATLTGIIVATYMAKGGM